MEEAHLCHLGALVQWQQQYAPDADLLHTASSGEGSQHAREELERLLAMVDAPGDVGSPSESTASLQGLDHGGSGMHETLMALLRKPEPTSLSGHADSGTSTKRPMSAAAV